MILLIDNYDSFTYNLYQLIGGLGFKITVKEHDDITLEQVDLLKPKRIVISPGPKRPEDAGVSMDVIKHFYKNIPILGVCLGHQCIGQVFGVNVVHAKEIIHGKTSMVFHNNDGLFKGLNNPFAAARYHSLAIDAVPREFDLQAWTADTEIMAIQHKEYPLYGIQFHPESFMTEEGEKLIKNFLSINS